MLTADSIPVSSVSYPYQSHIKQLTIDLRLVPQQEIEGHEDGRSLQQRTLASLPQSSGCRECYKNFMLCTSIPQLHISQVMKYITKIINSLYNINIIILLVIY